MRFIAIQTHEHEVAIKNYILLSLHNRFESLFSLAYTAIRGFSHVNMKNENRCFQLTLSASMNTQLNNVQKSAEV